MLILATDIHNKNVKNKMTKAEWVKRNDTLNGGKNFPEKFLLEIYDKISAEEFKTRDMDEEKDACISSPSHPFLSSFS